MALPKRKRQSRNEVDLSQPDEFISASQKLFGWAAENRKLLIVLSAALGAALVLFSGGREVVARKSATRANAFAKAVDILATPVRPATPEGDDPAADPAATPPAVPGAPDASKDEGPSYETAAARAEAALVEFSKVDGGAVSDLAQLGKATSLLDSGKPDEAAVAYSAFLASGVGDHYRFFGHDGLVTALSEKGDFAGALAELAKIATLEAGKFADHAAFRRGRLLESKGDKAEAVKAYKGLIEAHPESLFKPQADKRLGLLGG